MSDVVVGIEQQRGEQAAPPAEGAAHLPTSFPHLPALDGLRGIAVLSVVAYHFGFGWLPGGFLGVDTFFVLSGYLITSLLLVEWGRGGSVHLGHFWVRRARRLLPALFVVLAVVAVWGAIVLPDDRLGGLRADSLWTLFYGANWHYVFSEQSYFDLMSAASPLRHTWSLAIEEQFYLVWPLLFVAAIGLARGRVRLLVGLCLVGTVASLAVMGALATEGDPSRAYYGTDARAHGLLLGALLAVILAWRPHAETQVDRSRAARALVVATSGRSAAVLGAVGAVVMVAMFAVAEDRDTWLYPWGFLVFELAVMAVILAIASTAGLLGRALSWSALCWIGAVSYGLYLWHWPVIVFVHEGNTGLDGVALLAVRTGLILAATTLSYYLLEQPIRRGWGFHGWAGWVAAPVAIALVAAVILVQTRDAEAPPEYLVADPTTVLTVGPPAGTPSSSTATNPLAPVDPTAPARPLGAVTLMGDSIAASLAPAFSTYAASVGIGFGSAALPGCSMVTGLAAMADGTTVDWADDCEAALPAFQEGLAARSGASTVVWSSTWETADRWVDGTRYEFGTPEADAMLLRLLDESKARILRDSDAVLVFTLQPPNAATSDLGAADPVNVERMLHLNELLRAYAARHPDDTRVVDLAAIVCPAGPPCPPEVDGVVLRPRDGGHYSEDGGAWVAPRFFDALTVSVAGG